MVRRLKLLAPLSLIGIIWATSPAPTQPPATPTSQPSMEFKGGMRFGQQPGQSSDGEGGERRRRFGGDPSQMFDRLSGGKDVIHRDSLDERQKFMFDMFAKQMDITNGQITRAQFTQGAEQMRSRMGGGSGGFGGRGQGGGSGFGGNMTPQQQDDFAVERFRRSDRNGDGYMDQNEMSERLKPSFQQYDTNKDGMLDLQEYKGYTKSFFNQKSSESAATTDVSQSHDGKTAIALAPSAPATTPEAARQQEEDARAVVFRTGKLPKDIPNWFEQIDTDKDGQIGLYEWVKAVRPIDDFRGMDRNGDNFVTIDELMAHVRNSIKSTGSNGTAVASTPSTGDQRFTGIPSGGDRSGFRFGRGDSSNGDRESDRGGSMRWGRSGENGESDRGGSMRWGRSGENGGDRGGERGGPSRWGKGGENGGGFPRFGKGGENGGGFPRFGKGGENGNFRGYGRGGERGTDKGSDHGNNTNGGTAPGASTPPSSTYGNPPTDSRRNDGGRGNRREEKSRGRP